MKYLVFCWSHEAIQATNPQQATGAETFWEIVFLIANLQDKTWLASYYGGFICSLRCKRCSNFYSVEDFQTFIFYWAFHRSAESHLQALTAKLYFGSRSFRSWLRTPGMCWTLCSICSSQNWRDLFRGFGSTLGIARLGFRSLIDETKTRFGGWRLNVRFRRIMKIALSENYCGRT